jgi:hypothetical protein
MTATPPRGTPVKSLRWGTAAQAHAFYCVDEDSMRENDLLERRKVAFQTSPQEVKRLALKFGLTQGQIRGLLLKYWDDRARFEAEAVKLRME